MNKLISKYLVYYPTTLLKGENIRPHLKFSQKFQYLSKFEIETFQLNSINKIISHAKTTSEFYASSLAEVSTITSLRDFALLPSIGKSDLISSLDKIESNIKLRYETKTTGGSTGEPVSILKNSDALARERAVTWRAYQWAGVDIGDPQGRFWGVPHTKMGHLKAWVIDFIANRKRVSAFKLDTASLDNHYKKLSDFNPSYLYGYVSVLEALANHMTTKGLPPFKSLKSIITTSEVLYPETRKLISDCFNVKVFNEYGCGEVGSIAHECAHGNLHIMADNLYLETDSNGELIVTDFHNLKTPLIRYRTGDFGKISDRACTCGVNLPILESVQGRAYDIIQQSSGTSLHPEAIIYILEDYKKHRNVVSQFQAVQQKIDAITVYIVAKENWTSGDAEMIKKNLQAIFTSPMEVSITLVDEIQREKSGKMRVVKSLIR